MSKSFIPELPCENLVRKICGTQWRSLSDPEKNGALGVAIVKSVLDGLRPELGEISSHLGVDKEVLRPAYKGLSMNGIFRHKRIRGDAEELNAESVHAWGFYAGYASGMTGPWRA